MKDGPSNQNLKYYFTYSEIWSVVDLLFVDTFEYWGVDGFSTLFAGDVLIYQAGGAENCTGAGHMLIGHTHPFASIRTFWPFNWITILCWCWIQL